MIMGKYLKILALIIFTLILCNKSFAISTTGTASAYKIKMTLLELCEEGSSASSCLNPIVIGSGESSLIDIASTSAGATAASYGKLSKATLHSL